MTLARWWVLGALLAVLWGSAAFAASIPAASCSDVDVGTAVASAGDGDTVTIPAGDCTWSSQLTVTRGIGLIGAGEGITTIRDNVPKDGTANSRLILLNVAAPNRITVSNLTIVGQASDPNIFNLGHIAVAGSSKAFRIHHLTIEDAQTAGIRVNGDLWGLIDHFTFKTTCCRNGVLVGHSTWGGSSYGDGSWAEDIYWGTERAIYIEDSTFTSLATVYVANALDGLDGGRVVFRHNALSNMNTTSHGTDSGQRRRGIRQQEIYENLFTFAQGMAVDFAVWIRGGSGVVYNNTIQVPGGLNHVVKASNVRDTQSSTPWGICDGSSPYDENTPGSTGYRCVDQPGAGTSNLLTGNPPPATWVGNISEPFYVWNNTVNGLLVFGIVTDTPHVASGRDYVVGLPRPGYAAYPYPHPLQGSSPPQAPSSLQVR